METVATYKSGQRKSLWAENLLCNKRSSSGRLREAFLIAGEMSDASEVLSAIYESLEGVAGGDAIVQKLFQWQVSELASAF